MLALPQGGASARAKKTKERKKKERRTQDTHITCLMRPAAAGRILQNNLSKKPLSSKGRWYEVPRDLNYENSRYYYSRLQ